MDSETQRNIRSNVLHSVIPVAATSAAEYKKQAVKIQQANGICDQFFNQLEYGTPYASEDDAINAMAPIAVWFIGWAARQFAIMVIKALWREFTAHQNSNGLICKQQG